MQVEFVMLDPYVRVTLNHNNQVRCLIRPFQRKDEEAAAALVGAGAGVAIARGSCG